MSKGDRRFAALTVPCPKCGARPGFACQSKNVARPRVAPHADRMRSAPKPSEVKRILSRKPKGPPDSFYASEAWRVVRYQALKKYAGACQCCGVRGGAGTPLHVDHIKPRSRYPELALEITNLQVLCQDCNLGKLAWDQTDWRESGVRVQ